MAPVSNLSWRIAVGSTRVRIAWIFFNNRLNNKWWLSTSCERISNISLQTNTVGNMVDYLTLGVDTTVCSWARVNTVQVLTCFVGWAF